jgi:hypothetical protein
VLFVWVLYRMLRPSGQPSQPAPPWACFAVAAVVGLFGWFTVAVAVAGDGYLAFWLACSLGAACVCAVMVHLGLKQRDELRRIPRPLLAPVIPKGFATAGPSDGDLAGSALEPGAWRIEDLFPPLPPDGR